MVGKGLKAHCIFLKGLSVDTSERPLPTPTGARGTFTDIYSLRSNAAAAFSVSASESAETQISEGESSLTL